MPEAEPNFTPKAGFTPTDNPYNADSKGDPYAGAQVDYSTLRRGLLGKPEVRGSETVEFYLSPIDGEHHIRFTFPGDDLTMPDFIVEEHHKERYQPEWEAYLNNEDQLQGQTKLEAVPWLDVAMQRHLKGRNIFTLEGLAAMADEACQRIGTGGMTLRQRAQEYIAEQQKAKRYDEVEARNAELERRLAALEAKQAPKRTGKAAVVPAS